MKQSEKVCLPNIPFRMVATKLKNPKSIFYFIFSYLTKKEKMWVSAKYTREIFVNNDYFILQRFFQLYCTKEFTCTNSDGRCRIWKQTAALCPYCRLKKCQEVGMYKEGESNAILTFLDNIMHT